MIMVKKIVTFNFISLFLFVTILFKCSVLMMVP